MEDVLTLRQKKVLNFLKSYTLKKGFPPTLREIAFNFGLKGPRAPQKTLVILERKGFIRRVPGGSRAIEVRDIMPALGKTLSVPIVGRVRAGEPILAVENIEGFPT
jgi:repressor LexA